jgi:uncharacterized protein YkwD
MLVITAMLNQAKAIEESDYSNNGITSAVITVLGLPAQPTNIDPVADAVFTKTNAARSKEGKPPLKRNKDIDTLALSHSIYLADNDIDGHANWGTRSSEISKLGI